MSIFCETSEYLLSCQRAVLSRYRPLKSKISSQIPAAAGFLAILLTIDGALKAAGPPAKSVPLELADPAKQVDLDFDHEPDQIVITTTGGDPYFWFELPPVAKSERDWVLAFEYFCPQGIRGLEWRWGLPPSPKRTASMPPLAPAEGWTTYRLNLSQLGSVKSNARLPVRLDLGNKPGVRLRIRNLQLRPVSDQELASAELALRRRQAKLDREEQIKFYENRTWPAQIQSLRKKDHRIILSARWNAPEATSQPVFLIPRFDWSTAAEPATARELALKQPIELGMDANTFAVDPKVNALRWQLVRQTPTGVEPITPARYEDVGTQIDRSNPGTEPTRVAKGLTCVTSRFPDAMLGELGLGHASINVPLEGLLRDTPAAGHEAIQLGQNRWYFNVHRMRALDANARTAFRAAGQVAGILLLQKVKNRFGSLAHPEADIAGTYAMPDLTDADSVARYRATLKLLARRYGKNSEIATIDHWIVHNEVDYGWQWTNMGEQPMANFIDHYVRSMRLVSHAMRHHHADAMVFISLTHRWNSKDNRRWRTYAPRELLKALCRSSQLEGDFPWGVAYHPYPQSLWESDTWNDEQVRDDFDTPLITLKNLQVLERFMRLPECLDQTGNVRPVICSEQGFHASESDDAALQRQCAALLYTWQKLRECPAVIAFDYHRPVDHPNEGGLRLGLRSLPSDTHPLGKAKPAWEIYRVLGTEAEAHKRQQLESQWLDAVGPNSH